MTMDILIPGFAGENRLQIKYIQFWPIIQTVHNDVSCSSLCLHTVSMSACTKCLRLHTDIQCHGLLLHNQCNLAHPCLFSAQQHDLAHLFEPLLNSLPGTQAFLDCDVLTVVSLVLLGLIPQYRACLFPSRCIASSLPFIVSLSFPHSWKFISLWIIVL